eukprot:TRINITY_DN3556_c0_g1_i2.p1 TRINITY_DN3556_c0_g1~~TRINITY_DN3556_c0_g1_i2.p1  ORF type:complete len:732 (+),score=123.30 TRINITY_DN3556_c0_g1_i2:18-2213(+)
MIHTIKVIDSNTKQETTIQINPHIEFNSFKEKVKSICNTSSDITIYDDQGRVIDELGFAFLPNGASVSVHNPYSFSGSMFSPALVPNYVSAPPTPNFSASPLPSPSFATAPVSFPPSNPTFFDQSKSMTVSEYQKNTYMKEFKEACGTSSTISGLQVRSLLIAHQLDLNDLARIWDLSNVTGGNELTCMEYCIARYLVDCRKQNQQIPAVLPSDLLNSVSDCNQPQSFTSRPQHSSWDESMAADPFPSFNISSPPTPVTNWDRPEIEVMNFQAPTDNISINMELNIPKNQNVNENKEIWRINRSKRKSYELVFERYNKNGYVDGESASVILGNAGIDRSILAKIWQLADFNNEGRLSKQSLFIALHLAWVASKDIPIPDTLPQTLLDSSLPKGRSKGSVQKKGFKGFKDMSVDARDQRPIQLSVNVKRYHEQEINKLDCIGGGTFSKVWRAIVDGEEVAVKEMESATSEEIEMWKKEIEIMEYTRKNKYLVNIVGYAFTDSTFSIIMEYMQQGSLYDLIHKKKISWNIIKKLKILIEIGKGIAGIHSLDVIHRDLKSMNILINSNDEAKIADWGCSRTVNLDIMTVGVGSPLWMAPEVVRSHNYSFPSDIFSFGVVMYEVLNETIPKFNKNERRVYIPSDCIGSNIIGRCTDNNPNLRPTAPTVCEYLQQTGTRLIRAASQSISRSIRNSDSSNIVLPPLSDEGKWFKYFINYDSERLERAIASSGESISF